MHDQLKKHQSFTMKKQLTGIIQEKFTMENQNAKYANMHDQIKNHQYFTMNNPCLRADRSPAWAFNFLIAK